MWQWRQIKLSYQKASSHDNILNAVKKNLSSFKLSSWPRNRKLSLKLSIFQLKQTLLNFLSREIILRKTESVCLKSWAFGCDTDPPHLLMNSLLPTKHFVCFTMVMELSGVQFGLKSYAWFQNRTSVQREFDLKSKYDFRPKLHDPKFNCHFIRSVLKSIAKSFCQNQFPAMWALKSDWLFCCTVPFSLAEKKMQFRANHIARITSDFKMDLINM